MGLLCPIYFFRTLGKHVPQETQATNDPWPEILREAVTADPGPVVGTHFRAAVDIAAARHNVRFPPTDEPALRFIQLLERYSGVVSVLRRPGQDFLVAPAGRPELLASGIRDQLFGIRHDLFQAFTIISENRPFYEKLRDRVVWRGAQEVQEVSEGMVPIHPATLEAELALRQDFASGIEEPSQSRLLSSLRESMPLQAFGKAVQVGRLQVQWHSFRTERVLDKIQRWATEKGLEWKDSWLTQDRSIRRREDHSLAATKQVNDSGRNHMPSEPLQLLLAGLDAADLQRIFVPFDLVLKALSARRET
jgi:hypothetical protein